MDINQVLLEIVKKRELEAGNRKYKSLFVQGGLENIKETEARKTGLWHFR